MPKIGHVRPESPVTFLRNRRSRSSGIRGHLGPEYALKPLNDNDYTEWVNLDLWRVHQAVSLCVGIEALPSHVDPSQLKRPIQITSRIRDDKICLKWQRLYEATKDAMELRDLDATDPRGLHYLPPRISDLFLHRRVKPIEYVAWASKKGFQLPGSLITLASNESATDNRPKWEIPGRPEYFARQIGNEWMLAEEKRTGKKPGQLAIANHVEGELSNRGIKGIRGKFLDAETIKREMLTGITGRPPNGKRAKT